VKPSFLLFLAFFGGTSALGAQTAARVRLVPDGLVSVEARGVRLDEILAELDRVAGTESTAPPEIGRRAVSAAFGGLPLDLAIRRIFEGLGLDYAVVGGRRIVVLSESRGEVAPRASARVPAPSEDVASRRGADQEWVGEEGAFAPPDGDAPANPFQPFRPPASGAQAARGGLLGLSSGADVPATGGRTTPFGVPLEPLPGTASGRGQVFESILGNVPPTVLDVLGLTRGLPGTPPQAPRPKPGMPSSPPVPSR
jgi:hypothetical protein